MASNIVDWVANLGLILFAILITRRVVKDEITFRRNVKKAIEIMNSRIENDEEE